MFFVRIINLYEHLYPFEAFFQLYNFLPGTFPFDYMPRTFHINRQDTYMYMVGWLLVGILIFIVGFILLRKDRKLEFF